MVIHKVQITYSIITSKEDVKTEIKEIIIFPNPAVGQLNITTDLDEVNMQIEIYSAVAHLLQTKSLFSWTSVLDVSSLIAGTDVMSITSDKGFLPTEKFVKK